MQGELGVSPTALSRQASRLVYPYSGCAEIVDDWPALGASSLESTADGMDDNRTGEGPEHWYALCNP